MTSETSSDFASTSQIARLLGAYLPVTLIRQILDEGELTPGKTRSLMAATFFADISGFTAMSEELASDGPRGAEELNRVLLVTFTAMINIIHEMGGAVSHFYGDAMSVYFPDDDGQAALRALSCAQQMQQLMATSFNRVVTNRPPDKDPFFALTIKIGVGYGRCQELVVGDAARSMEFVLTGTAVDEATEAEKLAQSGQVVASHTIIAQIGQLVQAKQPDQADYIVFDDQLPLVDPRPVLDWHAYQEADFAQLIEAITPFVPNALHSRLLHTGSSEMAEHRPVTSLFVQFAFVGDDDDSSDIETAEMGRYLHAYYQWACDVVARYGIENARVNRVLTGDKGNQLHIMFGAPIAPDAPEQAIRCAISILQERPNYIATQKIGLAVGKVFAGPVGSEARREYTVVGDVVNLSARLMQASTPDTAWTDEQTAHRSQQWIEFKQLPAVHLKGRQTAVIPYQPIDERPTTSQLQAYLDRWDRPLFGRDHEVDMLLGGMDAALHGVGGIAALFGTTGSGKSRVLGYAARYWLDNGGMGLLGISQQHTAEMPFNPWRNIWRDFFGLLPSMSTTEQITSVLSQTEALVPGSEVDAGLWADPLGLPIPQSDALMLMTPEARQSRFFTLVRRCFQAAANRQPLLLILEGLHWADQSTLALLDEVTANLDGVPLFVAITFRPVEGFELETLAQPSCIPIPVSDLSPKHARLLLKHLLSADDLPPSLEQHLGLRDRDGRDSPVNPLFLEEALNVIVSAGVLEVNGRIQVNEEKLAQMQLPDTIHGLLLARLDRLSPTTRDLLQIASVIGRQFELDPLNAISGRMARPMVIELLSELTQADMTQLVTSDPEWVYLFQHAMTHEVAYESLPFSRRQELHAAVADWVQNKYSDNLRPYHPILAFHFDRAGIHEEGLHYALQAADDARAIFANKEAVDLYTLAESHLMALGLEERWETAVDLKLARGEALRFIGDFGAASNDVEYAMQLTLKKQDPERIAQAHNLMAELRYRQARFEDARQHTEMVINEFGSQISSDELVRAYHWLGMCASPLREYDLAFSSLAQAEKICLQTNNNRRLARVLEGVAFAAYLQKDLEKALISMKRSVELSRDFSIPANIASSLSNIALIQFQLGDAANALDTVNEAIALLEEASSGGFLASFLGNRAEFLCYLGKYDTAYSSFERAINLFYTIDDEQGLIEVFLVYGYEYYNSLQEWEDAEYYFQKAEQLLENQINKDPESVIRLLIGKGQIALSKNNLAEAEDYLEQAKSLVEENNLSWWRPVVLYFQGLLYSATDRNKQAYSQFQNGIDAIKNGGCPDYSPLILLELASIETDNEKKCNLLEECLSTAQQRSRILDRITCYKRAGVMLEKCGEDATEFIQKAIELEAKKEKPRQNA